MDKDPLNYANPISAQNAADIDAMAQKEHKRFDAITETAFNTRELSVKLDQLTEALEAERQMRLASEKSERKKSTIALIIGFCGVFAPIAKDIFNFFFA